MSKHVHYIDDNGRHIFSGEDDCSAAIRLNEAGTATVSEEPPDEGYLWNGTIWVEDSSVTKEATRQIILNREFPSPSRQLAMIWEWIEVQGLVADASRGVDTSARLLHQVKAVNTKIEEI